MMFGYDAGVLGGVQATAPFRRAMGESLIEIGGSKR